MKKGAASTRCAEQGGKMVLVRPAPRASSPGRGQRPHPGCSTSLLLIPPSSPPRDARTPLSLLCPPKPRQPSFPPGSSLLAPRGQHPHSVLLTPGCSSASAPEGGKAEGQGRLLEAATLKALNQSLF